MSDTAFLIAGMVISLALFVGLHLIISSGVTDDDGVDWQNKYYEYRETKYQETGDELE